MFSVDWCGSHQHFSRQAIQTLIFNKIGIKLSPGLRQSPNKSRTSRLLSRSMRMQDERALICELSAICCADELWRSWNQLVCLKKEPYAYLSNLVLTCSLPSPTIIQIKSAKTTPCFSHPLVTHEIAATPSSLLHCSSDLLSHEEAYDLLLRSYDSPTL